MSYRLIRVLIFPFSFPVSFSLLLDLRALVDGLIELNHDFWKYTGWMTGLGRELRFLAFLYVAGGFLQ